MMGDTYEPINTTLTEISAAYTTGLVTTGILTINELRGKMGYEPIDGGDIPFVMTDVGPIAVHQLRRYFGEKRINE